MLISSNNIYNPQQTNLSYGAVKDVVPQNINEKLPEDIQNLDAKQVANNNQAVSTMSEGMNLPTGIMTAAFYPMLIGLRSVNDKVGSRFSFAGDYKNTVFGKLTSLGDNITKFIRKATPDVIDGNNGILKRGYNAVKNFIFKHSGVARSLTTPVQMENAMALQSASGLYGSIMFDIGDMFRKGFQGSSDDIIKIFKNDGGEFWKILQSKGIESVVDKAARANIVSDALGEASKLGFKSDAGKKVAKEIADALAKSDAKFVIDKWGGKLKLPIGKIPVLGKLLTLNVPGSEAANKIKVATGMVGTSALGRGLAGNFAKIYEGLTNNVAGGKIAPIMQAYFFANAVIKAKEAPKGQKLATFMDESASAACYFITMPLAASLTTRLGGLKYIGMGKTVAEQAKNVEKYRNLVSQLNESVLKKQISRGEYLEKAKEIKNLLNGIGADGSKSVRFWQKPLKAIGKFFGSNFKAETIMPYLDDAIPANTNKLKAFGLSVSNMVKKAAYGFKTGKFMGMTPGGIARFALTMFVFSPLLLKPIQKVVHKIFGKPYNKEEAQKEQAQKEQEEKLKNNPFNNMSENDFANLLMKNKKTIEAIQTNPELAAALQNDPSAFYNLLVQGAKEYDMARQNAGYSDLLTHAIQRSNQNPQFNSPQGLNEMNPYNNSYSNTSGAPVMPAPSIQSQEPVQNEPIRTYIPSSKPADFVTQKAEQESSQFNAVLAKMDEVEKKYSQYIGI